LTHCRIVDVSDQGRRLDKVLTEALGSAISRSSIAEWIKEGRALVNSEICRRPAYRVQAGDRLTLEPGEAAGAIEPVPGPLGLVYEDACVLVLNKQPGLSVHPAPSVDEQPTLVNYLLASYPELSNLDPVRPGIVHRLDKDTSGLLVVARDSESVRALAAQLSGRTVSKEYLALVHGRPEPEEQEIELPLGRDARSRHKMAVVEDGGREAVSCFRVLETFKGGDFSLLSVRILTGRTHQIRVHLAAQGHPIVGDRTYGPAHWAELQRSCPRLARLAGRQMLHAWRLAFDHPADGRRLAFRAAVPKDMFRVLLQLERRMQRVGITGMPGSGKSALTERLAGGRVPSWSADQAVAELYEPGSDGWEMIRRTFGEWLLTEPGGPVDKQVLFRRMLESETFRKELLDIIHPLVKHRLRAFWEDHEDRCQTLAEVPLLLEAGWGRSGEFDAVVGVWCPREVRLKRLSASRGWDEDILSSLESWQLSEEEKYRLVDLVVKNDGSLDQLTSEARRLSQELRRLRRRSLRGFLDRLHRAEVL